MKYVKAARIDELDLGQKKLAVVEGKEILLVNLDNNLYGLDNRCPHMGGSLFEGKMADGRIVCPKHGSIFNIRTGEVSEVGKMLFMKVKVRNLKMYPVMAEGDSVYVGIE